MTGEMLRDIVRDLIFVLLLSKFFDTIFKKKCRKFEKI